MSSTFLVAFAVALLSLTLYSFLQGSEQKTLSVLPVNSFLQIMHFFLMFLVVAIGVNFVEWSS